MADQDLDLTEYNGGALVATAVAFLALSWTSVLLRGYVRIFMTNGFQMDDWLMVIAQFIFTVSCTFILLGTGRGLGRHNQALDQVSEIDSLMWQALATATYIINMMFIKLSIGIFLLRLAVQKVYRYILWVSLVVITIWSLVLFFWNIFQCRPVEAQWDYTMIGSGGGECVAISEVVAAAYALSVMTILSDWLYALLPIPMLWKVDMTKQAKMTVILILGLGVFASIATLIRLKFLADLEQTNDILFAGTDAMVWTLVEPGVAIVAASLATIRPLLRAMRVRGFDSTGRSGAKSGGVRSGTSRSAPGLGSTVDTENQYSGMSDGRVELDQFRVEDGRDVKSHVRNYSRPQGLQRAPSAQVRHEGHRPTFDKNELHVVEAHQQRRGSSFGTAYGYEEGDTSLSSFEMGHDAESQHSGRVGLGPGGF